MKDAKGHGSNKRGENSIDAVYSSKAGVGGLGKGMYARTASGEQFKLNPASTGGMIPRVGSTLDPSGHTRVGDPGSGGGGIKVINGQGKVARIAQAHGIQGGPFKVQEFNPKLVGTPFETKKSYRNNTVAEHVAKYMRTDGAHVRVKVR